MAATTEFLKQQYHLRGRWLKPHRCHLTLHLLSDSPETPDEPAARACGAAAKIKREAFALLLDRAGSIRIRARVRCLGCAHILEKLTGQWRGRVVAGRIANIVFDTRGLLTPHVTVLRKCDFALPSTLISPVIWHVDGFVLVHSRLGAQSQHGVLGRWPLLQPDSIGPILETARC